MKYWPTSRCAECLKIHFSFGEKASNFRARPILGELLYLKGFLCTASGMLISLNDVITPECNLEKDDKVVKNVWPINRANTISHHCSLISQSIQVSCNYFNSSASRAVNSLRHSGSCAVQSQKSGDRPMAMIY